MKFFEPAAPWLIASFCGRWRGCGGGGSEGGALHYADDDGMAIDGAETHLRLRHEVGRVLIGQALAVEELDDLEPLVGQTVELRHNGLRAGTPRQPALAPLLALIDCVLE